MQVQIPNSIGAAVNLIIGIVGIISPPAICKFVGISWEEKRGKSDIRATYGGVLFGLGGFALYMQEPLIFTAIGIAWACAAAARLISIFVDKSYQPLNFGGLIFESVVAFMLLWK